MGSDSRDSQVDQETLCLLQRYITQQMELGYKEVYLSSPFPPPRLEDSSRCRLEEFYERIKDCQRCPLAKSRKNLVFGEGNPQAEIIFVGEAPGADEDRLGRPFVGRAGQLLTKMLGAIDLTREDIYIANILKCRPPGNRDPLPSEVALCRPYLDQQIEIIDPLVICALGRIAAQTLLDTRRSLGELRGFLHPFRSRRLLVTYHPAALLRNPHLKRPAWEDLKLLCTQLERG